MNKPDLAIIQSPEAERMRQMVTAGFYDRSRIGLWLFEVIGREYDSMAEWARTIRLEAFPQTCTWSIGIWEEIYGIEPDDTLSLDYRRGRILSKKLEHPPINPARLEAILSALTGCPVQITENVAPYTFMAAILEDGVWVNYREASRLLRKTKPSHLRFITRLVVESIPLIISNIFHIYNIHRALLAHAPQEFVVREGYRMALYTLGATTPVLYNGRYLYDGTITWAGHVSRQTYSFPVRIVHSGIGNHNTTTVRVPIAGNAAPLFNAHNVLHRIATRAGLVNRTADYNARLVTTGNITYNGVYRYDGAAFWNGKTAKYEL